MATLKALAAALPWEEARDPVVQLCHFLFTNLTDEYVNTDVLCPGIIDNQGPHVSRISSSKFKLLACNDVTCKFSRMYMYV